MLLFPLRPLAHAPSLVADLAVLLAARRSAVPALRAADLASGPAGEAARSGFAAQHSRIALADACADIIGRTALGRKAGAPFTGADLAGGTALSTTLGPQTLTGAGVVVEGEVFGARQDAVVAAGDLSSRAGLALARLRVEDLVGVTVIRRLAAGICRLCARGARACRARRGARWSADPILTRFALRTTGITTRFTDAFTSTGGLIQALVGPRRGPGTGCHRRFVRSDSARNGTPPQSR